MHTIHNARVQLLATAMNNAALAVLVAGFLAPAVSGQLQSAGRVLFGLAWLGFSLILHACAQAALGGLRP